MNANSQVHKDLNGIIHCGLGKLGRLDVGSNSSTSIKYIYKTILRYVKGFAINTYYTRKGKYLWEDNGLAKELCITYKSVTR